MNFLDKVKKVKQDEIQFLNSKNTLKDIKLKLQDIETKISKFYHNIKQNHNSNKISVIAEIKKASPSKGLIKYDFNHLEIAEQYQNGKVTCISVLTDETFFQGSSKYLQDITNINNIQPLLQKDFFIDEYQIYNAKLLGADCILLMLSMLSTSQTKEYLHMAQEINLDVLIETHDWNEIIQFSNICPEQGLLGINNRNLKTLNVDVNNVEKQYQTLKQQTWFDDTKHLVVCESGIDNLEKIKNLYQKNIKNYLVGEFLMKHNNPTEVLININNIAQ